jgi:hypothetical protein
MTVPCFWCPSSLGQTPASGNVQVEHDSWTFKEGAPADVTCLAQTNDGFLWLGGPNGLFRFDGTRFEPFSSPFVDRLLSTSLYSLFAPSSVNDTGPGLPLGNAEQIFDAFFTTKPQGSGMGLAISKSIVESHGGRIWANGDGASGATFHFTLPAAPREQNSLQTKVE